MELEIGEVLKEGEKEKYEPSLYIETPSGTKISKKASIYGLQDIIVQSNVTQKKILLQLELQI